MKANLANDKFYLRLIAFGYLKVTSDGRAFNLVSGKELAKSKSGYRKISWQDASGKIIQIQLHRLVWIAFKGPFTDASVQVNHLDGVKTNCAPSNLEPTDNAGNVKHSYDNGLTYVNKGDDRPNAIWSDEEVERLRRKVRTGKLSIADTKRKYGCSMPTASQMIRGKTYKHLGG